ncbi:putative zinc finger protein 66 isoform X2 [Condylostylus longicornis]|uniref:putative zinc finger protein 66 isoform X2 n=1 Tax=Condylostylus longicornis TaxID=2530218 RepID=UPI00244DC55E|nr:putative zinc finger protein 66 isoform X2 [Condylostylus longicornis]
MQYTRKQNRKTILWNGIDGADCVINNFDDMPKNICLVCNEFLKSLQSFSEKARKVEEMLLEIDFNCKNGQKIETYDMRIKYGFESIDKKGNNQYEGYRNANYSKISNKVNITFRKIKLRHTIDNTFNNNGQFTTKNDENLFFDDIEKLQCNENRHCALNQNNSEDKISNISVEDEVKQELNDFDQFDSSEMNLTSKLRKQTKKIFNEIEKKVECEECHMKFVRESNYAYHLKKAHNVVKPILPCNICGKVCKTKQKLKFHMELHLPPEEREKLLFKCPECPQKFTQNGAMRSHVRAQHHFEKPFICEQCGKKFSSQTNLWSHRRSHDDKNHLTCPKCPKVFKNKFRLRVHMRGHNDSCHPCSICGLILKTMNTLKNHMLVHSDAKPFKCNFCGKDFKRDKNLQNHMITHSGLRPFICRFCGQSYANRSNCKKHEKHSHPKEYEDAASLTCSEPQQKVVKKLPNIQQLEAMLEQIKSDKINVGDE